MPIYSADFETTTQDSDCRVWAWGYCNIEDPDNVKLGNSIHSFMRELKEQGGIYYFHNLKFDGNFILYWLFKNGYSWIKDTKCLNPGQFTTLISDMGTWYTITIQMKPTETGVTNKVEIRDSLKIIPLSVEEIPKAYGLEESKLTLDYNAHREIGHILTPHEEEYIKADIIIVAKAIDFMLKHGQKKLTSASNALADFKKRYKSKEYKKLFPELNIRADADIRKSYKGGWTYLNPKFKNEDVAEGSVYDVNSMYPWAMKYCLLPWGAPVYFTGNYKKQDNYPLYILNFTCEFRLKPGKFPSIQLKKNRYFAENEYIMSSEVDYGNEKKSIPITLVLTSVDYELFLHNYKVWNVEYHGGYMFKAKHGMFTEYIDYWYEQKTEAKRTGNKGLERIAKLMLNSLYGKFGARMDGKSKIPYYDNINDIVRYRQSETEERKGGYLPVATFITSYCRDKIIRAAEVCGERFIYADTDSVHIKGLEPVPEMDVDEYRLGAFKLEETFKRARFIRQKTYLEIYDKMNKKNGKIEEVMNLKCCGMPEKMKASVSEEDFYEGAVFDSAKNSKFVPKLVPRVVPGGVILKETTFQIAKSKTMRDFTVIVDGHEDEMRVRI